MNRTGTRAASILALLAVLGFHLHVRSKPDVDLNFADRALLAVHASAECRTHTPVLCSMHKRGNEVYFVDINKQNVAPSFEKKKPDYQDDGTVFCLNGLDESHFIHLDFLDLAMAVMKGEIGMVSINAIHDGLDCTTFTYTALV